MQPEEAFRELTPPLPIESKSLDAAPPGHDSLVSSINASYFLLRRWIALVALALPITLWIGGIVNGGGAGQECGLVTSPNPSMSHYYHCPGGWLRDVFVGSLFAVGFFLYFYKGYTKRENLVLNGAGLSAVLVALFPMGREGLNSAAGVPLLADMPVIFTADWIHGASAVLLFLCVGFVSIFESNKTLKLLHDAVTRKRLRATYITLGTLMVAVPCSIFLMHLLARNENSLVIFFLEFAGIAIFASYWLFKSREIDWIMKQKG